MRSAAASLAVPAGRRGRSLWNASAAAPRHATARVQIRAVTSVVWVTTTSATERTPVKRTCIDASTTCALRVTGGLGALPSDSSTREQRKGAERRASCDATAAAAVAVAALTAVRGARAAEPAVVGLAAEAPSGRKRRAMSSDAGAPPALRRAPASSCAMDTAAVPFHAFTPFRPPSSPPSPLPPPQQQRRPAPPKGLAGGAEARRRLAAVLCEAAANAGAAGGAPPAPTLTCTACDAVPRVPVAAPCGHALCAGCWPCPRCASPAAATPAAPPQPPRPAVLLRAVLQACWSRELRAQDLLRQGDAAALRAIVDTAAHDNGDEALSPLLLSMQCHALHLLGQQKEALTKADHLRQTLPSWGRGHYWRGCFLLLACRPQEALTSLLLSVALSAGQAPPNPHGMPCPHTLIQAGLGQFSSFSEGHLQLLINWISKEVIRLRRLESKTGSELLIVPTKLPAELDEADFDCVLCSRTLYKPVTTPCGHTFCGGCLDRCLDHAAACPLCMAPLHDMLCASRAVSTALDAALRLLLPSGALCARELSAQVELAAPAHVPVFVCTVAWPGVPCPLYVFEPRYRLLVRRCVEAGGRRFGMAAGGEAAGEGGRAFADAGTLLDVRDWLRLPDGCSLLTAVGARRFRVLARAERDGYYTAKVELLRDRSPGPGVRELAARVRSKGVRWVAAMPAGVRAEVERAFGRMPPAEGPEAGAPGGGCWYGGPDGPAWPWWLLAILPLSPRLQVAVLATTSLEKRLHAIDKMLDRIQLCSG